MTTNQTLQIANRMIQHINFCLSQKMNLGEMFEYVNEDLDLNKPEISNIFNKVFFSNYKMEQFAA